MTKNEEQDTNDPERELEDLEPAKEAAEDVRGGRSSEPGSPVPIPYPN
jgi:hypothetical protein